MKIGSLGTGAALMLAWTVGPMPAAAQEPALQGTDVQVQATAGEEDAAWTGGLPTLLDGITTAMIEAAEGLKQPDGTAEAKRVLAQADLVASVAAQGGQGTVYGPLAEAARADIRQARSQLAAGDAAAASATLIEGATGLLPRTLDAEGAATAAKAPTPDRMEAIIGRPVINARGQRLGELAAAATSPDGQRLAMVTVRETGDAGTMDADTGAEQTVAVPAEALVAGRDVVALASFITADQMLSAARQALDAPPGTPPVAGTD